ncbi:LysE family translocator [Nonomuraea sp. NBC_00507]|uniref:LysE family translocator n=1 Tax=Nonomuraea sp. NBC_00507 TaxID=2976002 RepID=UPI002E1835E4
MINWAGFIPAALLAALIPGASQLLGLSNAVRHGTACALAGVGGRLAAFVVLIGLVIAGLGTVLSASATALTVVKWVGVVYLGWIGLSCLRQAWRPPSAEATPAVPVRHGLRPLVVNEFLVALSNPKALLLFAALLPQFTGGSGSAAGAQIALLGGAYLGIELTVSLGYVVLGGVIGATGLSDGTRQKVDLGSGVCLVGLAGVLAVDEVFRT